MSLPPMPLRKAALAVFATAVETCPNALDLANLATLLAARMGDVDDIILMAHPIICRLCVKAPNVVLTSSMSFVEQGLEKCCSRKLRESASSTDVEKAQDVIRSGLRVVLAMSKIRDASANKPLSDFITRSQKLELMQQIIQQDEDM